MVVAGAVVVVAGSVVGATVVEVAGARVVVGAVVDVMLGDVASGLDDGLDNDVVVATAGPVAIVLAAVTDAPLLPIGPVVDQPELRGTPDEAQAVTSTSAPHAHQYRPPIRRPRIIGAPYQRLPCAGRQDV